MRDDDFLMQRLENIWGLLFSEIPRMNKVIIKFKELCRQQGYNYKDKFIEFMRNDIKKLSQEKKI